MMLLTCYRGQGIWIGQMFVKYIRHTPTHCTLEINKPQQDNETVTLPWFDKYDMHPGITIGCIHNNAKTVRIFVYADLSQYAVSDEVTRKHYNQVRAEMNQAELEKGQNNVQTVFGQK